MIEYMKFIIYRERFPNREETEKFGIVVSWLEFCMDEIRHWLHVTRNDVQVAYVCFIEVNEWIAGSAQHEAPQSKFVRSFSSFP